MKDLNRLNSTLQTGKLHFLGDPYTVSLDKVVALRIYADSRPHNLEISPLQKGLILISSGRELIEEGVGFGVPVAIFSDKTYFSSSAELSINTENQTTMIVKKFYLDTVSRKVWRNRVFTDNSLYQIISRFFMKIYRKYPSSRRGIFPFIKLRNKFGIETLFTKVKHRGSITIMYKIKPGSVEIETDLTRITKDNCLKVFLLNEQGATCFRRFFDSDGVKLIDEKIGAWDQVDADWACLSNVNYTLGFRLQSLSNCRLLKGREIIKNRLSWAGMAYEIDPHIDLIKYEIKILSGDNEEWLRLS